jgi:manganese/zinc/iron transport system substrate-binding protein
MRGVATVGRVADIVRTVAGDRAEVTSLIGTGVDPHLYKPTRDDVLKLSDADIVFYAGLHLEGKMTDVLVRVARSKPVFAVSEDLPEEKLLKEGEAVDPHVWMDVSLWAQTVPVVVRELSKVDPAGAEGYAARGAALEKELAALHEYGQRVIASIPQERRVLITSHDAFSYFGRAYGIEVRGVQGISTESEAGLKDINDLVDFLVSRKISAVFVESSVPRKNVEALIEGARTRGHTVVIGGEMFSDAMGTEGTYEGTYIGMLDHNLTLAARALGGTAPEQGHHGRLPPFR